LKNKKIGKLTVIKKAQSQNGKTMWRCQCECGNQKNISTFELEFEKIISCGRCHQREKIKKINEGQKIGMVLTQKKYSSTEWICFCDCGKRTILKTRELLKKENPNCGCMDISKISRRQGINELKIKRFEDGSI